MKKLLVVLLLFTCSLSAQTFTVNGTTYDIVSGELLSIANSYARGFEVGRAAADGIRCLPTSVVLELRDDTRSGEVNIGTYVASKTANVDATSIRWTLTRWNGDVIDITDQASADGDLNFGYRAAFSPANGAPLDPVDGYVQYGDTISVLYTDACGNYAHTYYVPSAAPAIRTNGRPRRPPKVRRPV